MNKPSGDAMSLANYIKGALNAVIDEGAAIDSGLGFSRSDLWVTIEGKSFFISIQDKKTEEHP